GGARRARAAAGARGARASPRPRHPTRSTPPSPRAPRPWAGGRAPCAARRRGAWERAPAAVGSRPRPLAKNRLTTQHVVVYAPPHTIPGRGLMAREPVGEVLDGGLSGAEQGYFATPDDARAFTDELTHLLLHQKLSFNSPVWFNVGVEAKPQCSACFILSVDDTMDSILDWYRREGVIFKGGSGSGVNLSRLRSSKERLGGGGTASGPVSFMRAADASAGVIKSGGKTRRAAKM